MQYDLIYVDIDYSGAEVASILKLVQFSSQCGTMLIVCGYRTEDKEYRFVLSKTTPEPLLALEGRRIAM